MRREYCKIHRDAVFVHPALDFVELFACLLRVAHSYEGLRQDRPLIEISKVIFVEEFIVDALAERAGSLKIHCFDVQP